MGRSEDGAGEGGPVTGTGDPDDDLPAWLADDDADGALENPLSGDGGAEGTTEESHDAGDDTDGPAPSFEDLDGASALDVDDIFGDLAETPADGAATDATGVESDVVTDAPADGDGVSVDTSPLADVGADTGPTSIEPDLERSTPESPGPGDTGGDDPGHEAPGFEDAGAGAPSLVEKPSTGGFEWAEAAERPTDRDAPFESVAEKTEQDVESVLDDDLARRLEGGDDSGGEAGDSGAVAEEETGGLDEFLVGGERPDDDSGSGAGEADGVLSLEDGEVTLKRESESSDDGESQAAAGAAADNDPAAEPADRADAGTGPTEKPVGTAEPGPAPADDSGGPSETLSDEDRDPTPDTDSDQRPDSAREGPTGEPERDDGPTAAPESATAPGEMGDTSDRPTDDGGLLARVWSLLGRLLQ